jgi:tRNA(adenine34) deaminase
MHNTKKNYYYIDILINEINDSEIPITALVTQENNIIGIAHNKDHTTIQHAEIKAMQDAQNRLNHYSLQNCILYSLVEPCMMCYGYAIHSNIQMIYYILESDKSGIKTQFNIETHNYIPCIKINYKNDIIRKKIQLFFNKKR